MLPLYLILIKTHRLQFFLRIWVIKHNHVLYFSSGKIWWDWG
jgi:hypothetical protein